MSYNIVKKGESTILVKKFRDGDGKVREHYLMSLGVMSPNEFIDFRKKVHELPQDRRVMYCERSGRIEEVRKDIPRRKAPTGDIREPTVKKKRVKKAPKIEEKQPTEDDRPLKQSVVTKPVVVAGINVSQLKTKGQKIRAINKRVDRIQERINISKEIVRHKKGVQVSTKTEQQSINREIEYHQSVIDAGAEATKILKKQRSEIRT